MDLTTHPYRSVLYIPGSKERRWTRRGPCPPTRSSSTSRMPSRPRPRPRRAKRSPALEQGGYGKRAKIVRINALTTEWGNEDVRVLRDAGADIFLLPKVNHPSDVDALADMLGPDMPIWVMMETPVSVFNAREIAAHAQVTGLVTGTNDLIKDLGCRTRADRLPLMTALQMIVMAARAARGVVAIDGVYNRFRDGDGLKAECEQGRDLGFDGKTLIHPAQVEIANTAFAPTHSEIDLAERQIAAYEDSKASGRAWPWWTGRSWRTCTSSRRSASSPRRGDQRNGSGVARMYLLLLLASCPLDGGHFFKRAAPDMRAGMGNAGKGSRPR